MPIPLLLKGLRVKAVVLSKALAAHVMLAKGSGQLQFCRAFVMVFVLDFSGVILSFIYRDGWPQEIHGNRKFHDKVHALRMKIHYDECSAEGHS